MGRDEVYGPKRFDIRVSNGLYYHSYVGGSAPRYTGQHAVYVERYNPDVTVIFKGGPETGNAESARTGNYWNPPSMRVSLLMFRKAFMQMMRRQSLRTANLYDLLTRDAKCC